MLRDLQPLEKGAAPSLTQFEELLSSKLGDFYNSRTANTLQTHWLRLQHYGLLSSTEQQPDSDDSAAVGGAGAGGAGGGGGAGVGGGAGAVGGGGGSAVVASAPLAATAEFEALCEQLNAPGGDYYGASTGSGTGGSSGGQYHSINDDHHRHRSSGTGSRGGSSSGSRGGEQNTQPETVTNAIERELESIDGKKKRKIRRLEYKLASWKKASDPELNLAPADPTTGFDDRTLALVRGGKIMYKMQSREILIGLRTEDNVVDVDLSGEQPGKSISRRHAIIRLKHDRQFYLSNIGKRPVYVNGQPVRTGARCRLFTNSIIEICACKMLFTVNDDLLRAIRSYS